MTELRPKRTSFLFDRVSRAAVAATALAVVLAAAGAGTGLWALLPAALLVWLLLVGLSLWTGNAAWTKERYEVHPGHLVAHGGGVTSDWTLELDLKNVTHVKQHLAWIRYRFFDVGDVIVQSAGASSAEVVFRSVREPDELVAQLRAALRDNGFSLQGGELRISETPSTLGAVVECASIAIGLLAAGAWAAGGGLTAAIAGGEAWMIGLALGAGALISAGAALFLVLHFFDLVRRTYEVYDDVVEYREGFLSRTNAFIPFENIADAATKQTFLDQILGLYDVKVSCQGSGSEVGFRRLARGPAMQEAVRGLVDTAQTQRELAQQAAIQATPDGPKAASQAERPPAQAVPADQAWTAELRMVTARALFGAGILKAIGTQYTVGASSVASRYQLIGQQQLEFAYDKVTGVQVRTSPLDRVFGTTTVRIWSIGSALPLDLRHVRVGALDLPALLRQAGIPGGDAQLALPAQLGLTLWLRARVGTAVLVGLATLAGLAGLVLSGPGGLIAFAVPLVWVLAFLVARVRTTRQHLSLHEHHLEHRSGIFWRQHVYARYDDIKKIEVRRYAGTAAGRLTAFVAGETALQTKKGQATGVVQNRITTHFLPDVRALSATLDPLLLGRLGPSDILTPPPASDPGQSHIPAVANALAMLALIPPAWPLLPWVWLSVKRRSYRVEQDRAVIESGVLYRTHTSVLFDRIDSLNQGQGLLGKVFENGSVTLMTAGSSRPDLVLSDTAGYQELYGAIRARYGR